MNHSTNSAYIGIPPEVLAAHEARLRTIGRSEGKRPTPFRGIVRRRERWSATIKDPRLGPLGRAYLGSYPRPLIAAIAYDFALMLLGLPPVNYEESVYRMDGLREKLPGALEEVRARLVKAGWQSAKSVAEATPAYRRH